MYNHEYFESQVEQRELDNNRYNIIVELTAEEKEEIRIEKEKREIERKESFHSFKIYEYSFKELYEYSLQIQNDIKEILLKAIKNGTLKVIHYNFRWFSPELNGSIELLKKIEILKNKKIGTAAKANEIKKAA